MPNQNATDMVPDTRTGEDRRGVALITALFGVVVLAVMMSGMYFTSNQEFKGTRNALIEQRSFAVAEFGLNSEISNWDRSRNIMGTFPVGSIDSNQVYVAAGDTASSLALGLAVGYQIGSLTEDQVTAQTAAKLHRNITYRKPGMLQALDVTAVDGQDAKDLCHTARSLLRKSPHYGLGGRPA